MNNYSVQNILVPIDLSESSLNALNCAVAISKKHNATIYLLDIAEPQFCFKMPKNQKTIVDANTDVLQALASGIKHRDGVSLIVLSEAGNVVETICNNCTHYSIDLVVMGTHGASGYREGYIGSNAYNTIKYSACPVLTVLTKQKTVSFKKILFPIRPVFGALSPFTIASKFISKNATMDVLGLSYQQPEPDVTLLDKIVNEIESPLKQVNVEALRFWGTSPDLADAVMSHVQSRPPDLVVLTSILDVISKPGFIGPHTQKLLHNLRVPVLNVKKAAVTQPLAATQLTN